MSQITLILAAALSVFTDNPQDHTLPAAQDAQVQADAEYAQCLIEARIHRLKTEGYMMKLDELRLPTQIEPSRNASVDYTRYLNEPLMNFHPMRDA